MISRIPEIVMKCYPRRLWTAPGAGRKIYFTFDDGPVPEVTPWVLEQLASYGAKATFFCIGDNIRKYPEIFERIVREGHLTGNHTFNHLNGWKWSGEKYVKNVQRCQQIMEEQYDFLGIPNSKRPPQLFRPPYGKLRSREAHELEKLGFKVVMWEVLSRDYDHGRSPGDCMKGVVSNSGSGSIIVFHDSLKAEKNLRAILPPLLAYFQEQDFQFAPLLPPYR